MHASLNGYVTKKKSFAESVCWSSLARDAESDGECAAAGDLGEDLPVGGAEGLL
jgi:hypothetical protein